MTGSFDYHAARSVADAVALLQRYGEDAHVVAGGTSFVLMFNQGLVQPGHVVAIRDLPELAGVHRTPNGGLRIGAAATHRCAEVSVDVKAYCPALADMFGHVATIRIRNQATVGGNLAHADPAQDPPPMLLALDASVTVSGPDGERSIPLDTFFVDYFESALRPDEVLTSIVCPPLPATASSAYVKFLPRTQDDYATVAIGVVLDLAADETCEHIRIGLGSLGTTPLRARQVEQALRGQRLTAALVKDAAALVREEVDPLSDTRGSAAYKRDMAQVCLTRTLNHLLEHRRT